MAGAVAGLAAFGLLATGAGATAQSADGFGLPAEDARRIVNDILTDPRFTSRRNETIFTKLGRALTGFVQQAINWFNRVVLGVGDDSAGGRFVFWTIVTVLIIVIAAVVASRLARRRSEAEAVARRQHEEAVPTETPEALEQQAEVALTEGRNEDAVRLYYQAGLIRLGDRGVIEYRPSLTSGEVADRLRLAVFDHIAGSFDSIAYGHRPAGPDEVTTAKRSWQELLGEPR
ncbi:MAG: DUF4129 domain-containing protein [Acidimicrobiia bacterium]|nr:DUF4129 domain-containing protein [Acidimicrobiia bacterium]